CILGRIGDSFWQNAVAANSAPVEAWIFDPHVVWMTFSTLCREYALYMPRVMIWFAAAAMLVRCLWRAWRQQQARPVGWCVEPDISIATWVVTLATLVMATPIAVWWILVATLLQ